jgi:GTP-binding protein
MNIVAIVGRPNVGKSTLFNRLVGARTAIVDDQPGVTRDRLYHEVNWAGKNFLVVDTGGITHDRHTTLSKQVVEQVDLSLDEADAIVFLVDGKNGVNGDDQKIAKMLRRRTQPVVLAVNKIDTPAEHKNMYEFYDLGLGEPVGLSALRGTGGVGDLLDKIVNCFPGDKVDQSESADIPEEDRPLALAIVGKPNIGKSSMINALSGQSRTIVSEEPGTTRDAIDIKIKYKDKEYVLIDTAGIRRKSKVDYGVEAFAVARSLKAIDRADVVALMLDVNEPISNQEQKLATRIEDAGKPTIIVFNKWDLISEKSPRSMKEFSANAQEELRVLRFAEVMFVSAKNKLRTHNLLTAATKAYENANRRIGTSVLNQVLNEAIALSPPPPGKRSRRLRIYYSTQVDVRPPLFALFVNDTTLLTPNYQQYLERKLREAFDFSGAPIRFKLRPKEKRS